MKSIRNLFILTAAAAVLFTACSNSQPGASKAPAKGPIPSKDVSGPILNVSLDNVINSLDQQKSVYANSFELIAGMIDGLMQMADDGSVKNAIAESEEISPDGLIYTFKLRKDAYWSNGEPVTAHDFVYGWQRAIDPATESEYAFMMSDIAQIKNATAIQAGQMDPNQLGVRAIDDYTFQVELKVPVSYFEQLLYFCTFYPANEKFVKQCGENYGTSPETYLSNGAFILTDYSDGATSIMLTKNTAYYDADSIKLGGIHYQVAEPEKALSMFKANQLDLIELTGERVAEYQNSSEFKPIESGFLYYISPNLRISALKNRALRLALTLALDRDAITQALGDGSLPAYQCIPSGFAFNSRGQDFVKSHDEFKGYCESNPELARRYFEQAKAELGVSSLTLELLSSDQAKQLIASKAVKESLERNLPGLTINLKHVSKGDRRKIMAKGQYEIALTNWGPDYADPMTYLSMWMTGNDNNYGHYNDAKYDAIIADCQEGSLCTKPDERWEGMKNAETLIMHDAIILPVYQQRNVDLIKTGVTGIAFHPVAINRIYKNTRK